MRSAIIRGYLKLLSMEGCSGGLRKPVCLYKIVMYFPWHAM